MSFTSAEEDWLLLDSQESKVQGGLTFHNKYQLTTVDSNHAIVEELDRATLHIFLHICKMFKFLIWWRRHYFFGMALCG